MKNYNQEDDEDYDDEDDRVKYNDRLCRDKTTNESTKSSGIASGCTSDRTETPPESPLLMSQQQANNDRIINKNVLNTKH